MGLIRGGWSWAVGGLELERKVVQGEQALKGLDTPLNTALTLSLVVAVVVAACYNTTLIAVVEEEHSSNKHPSHYPNQTCPQKKASTEQASDHL